MILFTLHICSPGNRLLVSTWTHAHHKQTRRVGTFLQQTFGFENE